LNFDGRLIFQPSSNGIDVLDGNLRNLRTRIALPVALNANYDALAVGISDNVLIAITGNSGNGIAIIDLSSLPEPSLSYQAARDSRTRSFSGMRNIGNLGSKESRRADKDDSRPAPHRRTIPHGTGASRALFK
jgi:hypothetical protein